MTTTTEHETPTAWVGCLACYNSGRLVGRWITADEWTDNAGQLPDIDRAYWTEANYPTGSPFVACVKCGGDEFIAMDTENTPTAVGENLSAWGEWVETVQDLDEMQVEAFRLYIENGGVYGLSFAEAWSLHEDKYISYYDTFREFAVSHFMDTTEIPEHLERYLDEDTIERDAQHDFMSARGASGFVHVWYDN